MEDFNEFATPTMGSAESYYWDIILNNKEFYQFLITLDQRTNLFKDIGPFGIMAQDKIKSYIRNKALLTLDGRKFLYSWRYENKLFVTKIGRNKYLKSRIHLILKIIIF